MMEMLFMWSMIIGAFAIVIGCLLKPKRGELIWAGGFFIAASFCTFAGESSSNTGILLLVFSCIAIGSIVAIVGIVKAVKAKMAEGKEKSLEIGSTKLDRFFVECVLASCNDFTLAKNRERAKLLAQKYGLNPNGIGELYKQGLKQHEVMSRHFEDKRIAELRKAEQEEYSESNRYASLQGKDKTISMLTDKMNELRRRAEALDRGADTYVNRTQQQEVDWATWGGFASGLAGPAAGVATAVDIQARNAEIRKQNMLNLKHSMPGYMMMANSASECKKRADQIEQELVSTREKLISNPDPKEVFSKLAVEDSTIEVSETGAYRVTATIRAKENLYMYDDVWAAADGTIIAHIYEDGKEIGTANLVLPVNGVSSTSRAGVVGIGLSGAHREKMQSVKFKAGNMWLIETKAPVVSRPPLYGGSRKATLN